MFDSNGGRSAPTAGEARDQLAASEGLKLSSDADEAVRAIGTALVGLAIGSCMVIARDLNSWLNMGVTLVFVALVFGVERWMDQTASSTPRGSKRIGWWGLGGTMVVTLFAVQPVLNLAARSGPVPVWMLMAGTVVSALPMLVAAWIIWMRRS